MESGGAMHSFRLEQMQFTQLVLGSTPTCVVRALRWRNRLVAVKMSTAQDYWVKHYSPLFSGQVRTFPLRGAKFVFHAPLVQPTDVLHII